MAEQTMKITAADGVHARPATALVQVAGKYQSDVNIEYKGKSVNMKSIMGVMSLGIPNGAEVTFKAEGSDEAEAVEAVVAKAKEEGLGE
ncbi:phosphocarrier protein HPr [Halobacillus litoralis]|uniref:Phosphocarrier protein HPr n=4 Tax=Halobacillus TaxID=45667 RepID=A0A845E5E5_9BACI|nr:MULTISPECIES: phosphocarrier protein HPr [Halobacillus]MBN9656388.1 phosphocarrier protein HPr [Halobacillus sp. GSS1]MBX0359119.1 phosphocarrier protein HPr [Halobacillus sp. Nhm2S1]MEC3882166.1 phosphocarrier protein HPr [Halobacillus sp. HZG1]MYL51034.1 phosphocarrier protein HPr [Halobacillus litoralis]MYL72773.1 phosphocarrier protein HPr [Halobacillus litoralis]